MSNRRATIPNSANLSIQNSKPGNWEGNNREVEYDTLLPRFVNTKCHQRCWSLQQDLSIGAKEFDQKIDDEGYQDDGEKRASEVHVRSG